MARKLVFKTGIGTSYGYTILIGLIDSSASFSYGAKNTPWTDMSVFIWKGSSPEDNINIYYYDKTDDLRPTRYKDITLPQRRNFFACLYSSLYKTI